VVELPLLCKDFILLPLSAVIRHGLPGADAALLMRRDPSDQIITYLSAAPHESGRAGAEN